MGLAATGLDQLSESCRQDPKLWRRYFEATQHHLESKAIDLKQLGKEVQWLKLCKPEKAEIPPLLELAWLTAELEATNHLGHVDEDKVDKLRKLCDELYAEKADMVCQAELVLAVRATNQFQFDEATRALERWKDKDPAVAGIQHTARVHSSLGQHAAFRGDHDAAETHFAQAIDIFELLSDPTEKSLDIRQTANYRAIAAMNCPETDREITRQHVEFVTPLGLEDIGEMAISASAEEKFAHHLLLRYLVQYGIKEERTAYLSARKSWRSDQEGHPWPLIQCCRALLLHADNAKEALRYLHDAFDMTMAGNQGPTVKMIGLVIGLVAMGWGAEEMVTREELEQLQEELPAASDRIDRMVEALSTPPDPAESLLAEILPFNFR
jgi:hypothetical protein